MTTGPTGKWRKSPDALVALFDAALPDDQRVERRKMFGYPCAFVGGHMFTGLHQDDLVVRLSETERQRLIEQHGARAFEPMPGRIMREYVVLPAEILASRAKTAAWLQRGLAYASTLSPKPRKARRVAPLSPRRTK